MQLVKCPFCGKEIESDSFYCDQCGEVLKLCPTHGFKKGNFCNECTTKTALVYAKDAGSPAIPQQSPQQVRQQPTPQQQSSQLIEQQQSQNPPEKTTPKYLYCNAIDAQLVLVEGAIIGRRTGDYISTFGSQGYVSATHARLQKNDTGSWEIVDLNSTNGTFLNGKRLTPHQPVGFKTGDEISFYDLKFKVE